MKINIDYILYTHLYTRYIYLLLRYTFIIFIILLLEFVTNGWTKVVYNNENEYPFIVDKTHI